MPSFYLSGSDSIEILLSIIGFAGIYILSSWLKKVSSGPGSSITYGC